MKKIMLSLAVLSLSAAGAYAQAATDFASVDADQSGEISWTELQVAFPDLTEEQFTAADLDKSAGLNAEEFATLTAPAEGATTPAP